MTNDRFKTISGWLWGIFAAFAFFGSIMGALDKCSPTVPPSNAKIDTVLQVRHDTIKVLKDSLRTKFVYIDTSRIDTVEKILDTEVPPIGDENICIAENQLRECVKCQDSLEYSKKVIAIDSQTIDSLAKIAKTVPDTIKIAPSVLDRAKDIGMGMLIGVGIRSFF